jgi:hypothetical protein
MMGAASVYAFITAAGAAWARLGFYFHSAAGDWFLAVALLAPPAAEHNG